jgi:GNAT superfamily N-acetyltransferase
MEWHNGDYSISTDKSKLDIAIIYTYLSQDSYWAEQIPVGIVQRSIENSLCFGLYQKGLQVGFARIISDFATFAYLADVFVLPEHRGKGLSKWMMQVIMDLPDLQGLRRFLLTTRDAHGLYSQFGFTPYAQPERLMTRNDPDIYKSKK